MGKRVWGEGHAYRGGGWKSDDDLRLEAENRTVSAKNHIAGDSRCEIEMKTDGWTVILRRNASCGENGHVHDAWSDRHPGHHGHQWESVEDVHGRVQRAKHDGEAGCEH